MAFGRPKIDRLAAQGDVSGLVAALGAKHAEDRWRAAYALGDLRAAAAADALGQALTDADPLVQEAAAVALAQLGDPRATPTLLRLADDTDPQRRFMGAAMLGLLADQRGFDTLLRLLGDQDGDVQRAAASGLIRFRGVAVTDALVAALDDPARAPAAMLAVSHHRAAVQDRALRTIVRSDRPERLWRGGIRAGNDLVASRPATVLALLADRDASARRVSAGLVRQLGSRADVEAGVASAVDDLADRGDVEALIQLGQCVEIPSWDRDRQPRWRPDRLSPEVRVRVTRALGRVGDPRATDTVAQQFGPAPSQEAGEIACARAAAAALPELWDAEHLGEPGRAAIRHALVGSNADSRLAAALAQIGDNTAVGMLLDAFAADRDCRRAITPDLRHVTDARVLVPRLFSRSADVRNVVTTAITHLGPAATPALLAALPAPPAATGGGNGASGPPTGVPRGGEEAPRAPTGDAAEHAIPQAATSDQLGMVVDLLGKVGDRRAVEPLLALLERITEPGVVDGIVVPLLGKGSATVTRMLDILLQDEQVPGGATRPRGSPATFAMLLLEHGKSLDAAQQARAAVGFRACVTAGIRDSGFWHSRTGADLHRLLRWRIKGDEPLLRDVEVHDVAEVLVAAMERAVAQHRTLWGEPPEWEPLGTVVHDRIGAFDDDQLDRVIALEPIECEVWGGDEREMGGSFVTLDPEPLRQQAKAERRRRGR